MRDRAPATSHLHLTDEERSMLAGEGGPARQWAIQHQMRVGSYFGATDFVPVSQAHIMADTESLVSPASSGWKGLRRCRRRNGRFASPPSPIRAAPISPPRRG